MVPTLALNALLGLTAKTTEIRPPALTAGQVVTHAQVRTDAPHVKRTSTIQQPPPALLVLQVLSVLKRTPPPHVLLVVQAASRVHLPLHATSARPTTTHHHSPRIPALLAQQVPSVLTTTMPLPAPLVVQVVTPAHRSHPAANARLVSTAHLHLQEHALSASPERILRLATSQPHVLVLQAAPLQFRRRLLDSVL